MNDGGSRCDVNPAMLEDLDWIFRRQIVAYSPKYAVAKQTLEQWYGANPNGFSVLSMNGSRMGLVSILPLRPTILEKFVLGTILERDINRDCLYTPEKGHLIRNLYVESIILDSPTEDSTLPIKAFTCLAHDFVPVMRRLCDPAKLENIFALAASGRGERFMKRLGFNQVKSSRERPDNRALYVAAFRSLEFNISELYARRLKNSQELKGAPDCAAAST